MDEKMSLEECLQWCFDNEASVSFSSCPFENVDVSYIDKDKRQYQLMGAGGIDMFILIVHNLKHTSGGKILFK